MARLELRVFIRAPRERVWQVLADLEGQKRWMVDLRRIELHEGIKSGSGAVMDVTSELFGLPVVKDVMEITTWQPPHEIGVLHRGQFSGIGAFVLEPAPGGTIFTWWEDFKPPLGPLGELGFNAVVGPHLRRVFTRSMDNVRRLAEAEPDQN